MAKIIPENVSYFNSSYGEKLVYECLKKLPDEYVVFYSTLWQQKDRKYNNVEWGEADFTVFHPQKGILVIEVKSGEVSFKEGAWWQTRLDNRQTNKMKDPIKQANKSVYKFISAIDDILPLGQFCSIEPAVWFPSNIRSISNMNLPLAYNKEFVFTNEDLEEPENAMERAYKYYNSAQRTKLNKNVEKKIIERLAPEFDLIKRADFEKNEKDYSFLKLTREQSTLLDYLTEQRKVCIQGSAGTGKTLIAIEESKRLSEER